MAFDGDLQAVLNLDTSAAQRKAADFARSFPAIKIRVDGAPLGRISREVNEFDKSLAAANSRTLAFASSAGQLYGISRAFGELVKQTVEVQKSLANINVILNLSQGSLAQFSTKLFGIANTTAQSFKTVSETALQFARQGLGVEETLKRTSAALTLARIGGVDLDTSMKAITTTLNTFTEAGIEAYDIVNKIATVDTKFSVSGNVIAEALTRVASTAEETGVSFDRLIGVTTALQQITARGGAVIGNSLKAIFTRIERPQTIQQLNEMGIITEDLNGKMLSADTILTNLAKKYNDLTSAQKAQIDNMAAGLFQINQFRALIGDLAKENGIAARATQTAADSTDQATRRQTALNQTLSAQIQQTLNNLTQFASKVGDVSIAPALQNLLKGVNFATDTTIGEGLGEGILKGLGNFLSGPGLAIVGTLAYKLSSGFASYATKSFAQILEVGSSKLEKEKAFQNLLLTEPALVEKINQAGNDTLKIQNLINDTIQKQISSFNAAASAAAKVGDITAVGVGANLSNKPFIASGGKIIKNGSSSGLPFFSETATDLMTAIAREKAMGVDPSTIRIGASPQLVSPDNPNGLGVYNTKDEPLGLSQGISRAAANGVDPKKNGLIPNYADTFSSTFGVSQNGQIYLNDLKQINLKIESMKYLIDSGLLNQKALNSATVGLANKYLLTQEAMDKVAGTLNQYFSNYKSTKKNPLLLGYTPPSYSGEQLPLKLEFRKSNKELEQELYNRFPTYNGNNPETTKVPSDLVIGGSKYASLYNSTNPKYLYSQLNNQNKRIAKESSLYDLENRSKSLLLKDESGKENILLGRNYGFENLRGSSIVTKQINEYLEKLKQGAKQSSEEMKKFASSIESNISSLSFGGSESNNLTKFFRIKNESGSLAEKIGEPIRNSILQEEQRDILRQKFQSEVQSISLSGALFGSLSPNSKYRRLSSQAKEVGGEGIFNDKKQELSNKALGYSFLIPIVAGIAQTASKSIIGDDSSRSRGFNSLIGGAGNVASYAGLGFSISGGNPIGALIGGTAGLALEAPSIYKSFSDNSPEVQKKIDKIKELIQKNDESLTKYVSSLEQIKDFSENGGKKSRLTKLQSDLFSSYSSLPYDIQKKINNSNGDLSSIYEIKNNYIESLNQKKQLSEDALDLPEILKNKPSKSIFGNANFNEKTKSFLNDYINPSADLLFRTQNENGESIGSILGRIPLSEGKKAFSYNSFEVDEKTGQFKNKNIQDFLNKYGFNNDVSDLFLKNASALSSSGFGNLLANKFSPALAQKNASENNTELEGTRKELKAREDLNAKLLNLSVTGADAINKFEINVLDKLNSDLTDLKVKSIKAEGAFKRSEIYSGSNDYSKAFYSYQRANSQLNDEYGTTGSAVLNIQKNFSSESSKYLFDLLSRTSESLNKSQINSKNGDGSSKVKNNVKALNSVLGGSFSIDPETFQVSSSGNLDINTISNIRNRAIQKNQDISSELQAIGSNSYFTTASQLVGKYGAKNFGDLIDKNGNNPEIQPLSIDLSKLSKSEQSRIRGLDSKGLDSESENFQGSKQTQNYLIEIINKLGEMINQNKVNLDQISNELKSGIKVNQTTFEEAIQTADTARNKQISDTNLQGSISRLFSSRSNDLLSNQKIVDRYSATDIEAKRTVLIPEQERILNKLNESTGLNLGDVSQIGTEISKQNSIYNGNKKSAEGIEAYKNINELTKAQNELANAEANAAEKAKELRDNLDPFSDINANYVKSQNIAIASNGNVGATEYKSAFLAPLQYNQNDFQRDSVVGLQDIVETFKNDLPNAMLEATKGAKSTGEAFKKLALSLAEDVEQKAVKLGFDSLLGSLFNSPKSNNGNGGSGLFSIIGGALGFAKGGFVNMGSGVKDDVPALLSGGEFVINKAAVAKIGKSNLDAINSNPDITKIPRGGTGLNQYAGITTDSISGNSNSANVLLSNALLYENNYSPNSIQSKFLSNIGASSSLDPQNKVKYNRQRWLFDRSVSYNSFVSNTLQPWEREQRMKAIQADIAAVGSIAGAGLRYYNSLGSSSSIGTGGNSINYDTSNQNYGFPNNYDITTNPGGIETAAKGGYIRGFASGGMFGGDSSSDSHRAMIMGGEYVMSPSTVNKYGKGFFENLNNADKYASGGLVGSYGGNSSSDIVNVLSQIRDRIGSNSSNSVNQNNSSNNQTNHVSINVTMANDGSVSNTNQQQNSSGGKGTQNEQKDTWGKISGNIKSMILKELTEQNRPGGLLYVNNQKQQRK